mmetsp:Transcript_2784/g.8983  ORF Transcript_2784/g.8983 Transcript_2784/m.8983 type:complete len:363 (+) Transcript_2784:1760-2848(+)
MRTYRHSDSRPGTRVHPAGVGDGSSSPASSVACSSFVHVTSYRFVARFGGGGVVVVGGLFCAAFVVVVVVVEVRRRRRRVRGRVRLRAPGAQEGQEGRASSQRDRPRGRARPEALARGPEAAVRDGGVGTAAGEGEPRVASAARGGRGGPRAHPRGGGDEARAQGRVVRGGVAGGREAAQGARGRGARGGGVHESGERRRRRRRCRRRRLRRPADAAPQRVQRARHVHHRAARGARRVPGRVAAGREHGGVGDVDEGGAGERDGASALGRPGGGGGRRRRGGGGGLGVVLGVVDRAGRRRRRRGEGHRERQSGGASRVRRSRPDAPRRVVFLGRVSSDDGGARAGRLRRRVFERGEDEVTVV